MSPRTHRPWLPNEDRFDQQDQLASNRTSTTTNPIPNDVSIVMTHGPPKGVSDLCPQGNVGCDILLRAIHRVKPLMHCFEHIYESSGVEIIESKKNTKTVPALWKNETMQRDFEQDRIGNPYPQPFTWKCDIGR